MTNTEPKRIIVLGIMRSGTSLTAELVRLWGAYAGTENELWKSDSTDPRGYGYMEYLPLQTLNDELLDHNDRIPQPAEVLKEKASQPEFREKALQLLSEMDQAAAKNKVPAWVWKDARLPLTIPFWNEIWGDVAYVITVRHPAETILSLAKAAEVDTENLPFSAGLAYWQFCMLNVLLFSQKNQDKIFFTYDQFLQNPERETERLCQFLDTTCELAQETGDKRLQSMLPHIAKKERHYQYTKSLADMEQATSEQRALYNFLRVKTLYPQESFRSDDFALYPGWREYLENMDALMMLMGARDM